MRLAPAIGEGTRVRIKAGPLQGLEGWVERRSGMSAVLLRLDLYQSGRRRHHRRGRTDSHLTTKKAGVIASL